MKEKGFTLIELLAVIVILAIIALIAVPIILNIIEDSKNSSNKRSIELYARAVENAIGQYQLKNPQYKEITFEKVKEYIEYKGNKVECETTEINEDGTIYLDKCKIDDKEVEYTYGKKESKSIVVYRNSMDTIKIGDIINPNDTTKFTTEPTILGKNNYLKHAVDENNQVTESYACAIYNSKETCVRGGNEDYYGYAANESEYTGNALILKNLQNEGFVCFFSESAFECNVGSVSLHAYSDGGVDAHGGDDVCIIGVDGDSNCAS